MTLDTRRKAPSSSTPTHPASQGSATKRGGPSIRSLSSGSITPMEDEEDKPKRSTRGRNPLPPTKGPLFPPLPPKPTRPQASPRPSQDSKEPRAVPVEKEEDEEVVAGPSRSPDRTPQEERPSTPEAVITIPALGSGTSLTPPPPSSDNVEVVIVSGNSAEKSGRGRRPLDIKMEMEDGEAADGEEEDDTPRQTRTTRGRLAPPGSRGTTPTGSVGSDKPGARISLGRRRRGEEQLLLDDHLLPEEIRRTSTSGGKKKGGMDLVEKQEEIEREENGHEEVEEEVQADEPEAEAEEEQAEEEPVDDIIEQSIVDPDEEAVDDEEGDEVTRCVCQLEDGDPLMVACDKCNVWQHGPCVGIWADEEAPDEYFCERCKPELHGPLRKWMRSKGRNIAHFTPPSPEDLKTLHSPLDRYPPSQSKRWLTATSKYKSTSRSRKQDPSPIVEPPDRRQSRRGDPIPSITIPAAPTSHREKSAKADSARPASSGGREGRRGSSHHRRISIGSRSPRRDSRSPTARINGTEKEPRKRSTMNSRDAAFEDAVQAAIEASKREMDDEGEDGVDEQVIMDEPEDKEVDKKGKGKRKREEEIDPSVAAGSHAKIKHANQYTYRPKPSSAPIPIPAPVPAASPARRLAQHTPPIPQIPPPALHEHGTRRAGALANGAREAPFIAVSVTHLGWHLPDYLSGFSDIFSSPIPIPLQVRSPRTLPPLPRNHYTHHRYGPFNEERDEDGKLPIPGNVQERIANGKKGETHTEPPARLKYPQRRVTTGEMRKRVRHMLEFCGRVEMEEGKRGDRKEKIGIPNAQLPEEEEEGDMEMDIPEGSTSQSKEPKPKTTSTKSGPTAAQLLAELTADLREFQDTWARGGFNATAPNGLASTSAWNAGGYSPSVPGSAAFSHPEGWPTSSLGRDVVGPEGYEQEGDVEVVHENGIEGEGEVPEIELGSPPPTGSGDGENEVDQQAPAIEAEMEDIPSVQVYREGIVTQVIATQAEEEAAERIDDSTAAIQELAEAEVEAEAAAAEGVQEMANAVELLRGVGVANEEEVRVDGDEQTGQGVVEEPETLVDGEGDVVMAE